MGDYEGMDDVEFIEQRRKAREAVEASPEDVALRREFEAIDAEFLRRAGVAWVRAY
jgi:hypothetical protein